MRRIAPFAALSLLIGAMLVGNAGAHPGQGAPTWNREISRIVFDRCVSCHRPEGTAFSLLTYADAQRRGNDIKDAVLARRMPPWGAIKGFGQFRNDQSLSPEQLELIVRWVDAGMRRGNNPNQLPPTPAPIRPQPFHVPADATLVRGEGVQSGGGSAQDGSAQGDNVLGARVIVDALFIDPATSPVSARIWATLPNGASVPLVWLHEYDAAFGHPFLLRTPVTFPSGTRIHGLPKGATLALIPPATKH